MKRLLDILLVLSTAVVWLPLLLFAMIVVRLGLGKPVFFLQERIGKGGRSFQLHKLRTMREGEGEGRECSVFSVQCSDHTACRVGVGRESDAERLTSVGRWLRRMSLDELPELFHILRGEMSLVGPRPMPVRYLSRYSAEQARRHEVRPGLTGWAQVNGRNTLTWEQKFEYDVWYVDNQSLWLDIRILWLTLWQVVQGRDVGLEEEFRGEEKGSSRVREF